MINALHYNETTQILTWNENFTGEQEYYGFSFERNLIIEPNNTLFIEYCTNDSWKEPLVLEQENIDIDSLFIEYDFDLYHPYLLDTHEAIAEGLAAEYRVVQYYQENFEVYNETEVYAFNLSIADYPGNYSLINDFENVGLYGVVGIKPNFESEELVNNTNFEVIFDIEHECITIIDLNETDGLLDAFDTISVIINFTKGPVSSYSELYLIDEFWNDYFGTYTIKEVQESFYSSLNISFSSVIMEGVERVIAGESAELMVSDYTEFNPISYCHNPKISADYKFYQYGKSAMFTLFERFYDPFNIIYQGDLDSDGTPEYKQTIDIDKDYSIDIIKYGCENEEGLLVWHTVIQEFHSIERKIEFTEDEKLETLWFDLKDTTMDGFMASVFDPFNLQGSLTSALDSSYQLNYFGKKVIESERELTQTIKKDYYSVRMDYDKDGYADQEVVYQKYDVNIKHEITKTMKFLIAAKETCASDILNSKIERLFKGVQEDPLFNPLLTEDVLDQAVLSFLQMDTLKKLLFLACFRDFATVLLTYRKFILHDIKQYNQELINDQLIYRDWEEGKIVEERVYKDDFSEDDMNPQSELLFGDILEENTITNIDTGQEQEVTFNPFVPFASPANISWECPTWGKDNVPIYYDSLTVANDTYSEYTTNYYERTITITLLTRSSVLYAYGDDFSYPGCIHASQFEVTGVFITPPDGVYISNDKLAFMLNFKVAGHYLYYDSDNFGEGLGDGFYDTVYVLSPSPMADGSYLVYSMVYNYDGVHDVKPYTIVGNGWGYDAKEIFTIAVTSLRYPFCDAIREFFIDHIMDVVSLEEQDSIFELYKSTLSMQKYPVLFAEARRETYNTAWEVFGEQMWGDFAEQVFITYTSIIVGTIFKCIPILTALSGTAFILTYSILTKYFMDEKAAISAAETTAQTFYTLGSRITIPLNDRAVCDRLSRDSSMAALKGHPGAYYTMIHGGPTGHDYTAEVIASPANEMRTDMAGLGLIAYVATLGTNPYLYFGLDFDYTNIDYEQFTTALYSYNDYPFYTYYHEWFGIPIMSDTYQYNTLGYIEQKITGASRAMNAIFGDIEPVLDEIRPIAYDGVVRYIFEERTPSSPISPLFQPIVLSEPRYNLLNELGIISPGHLGIIVRHADSVGSMGMNAYGLSVLEHLKYKAKVPLAFNKTFGYPIISIKLSINHGIRTIDTITVPEDMYEVVGGNLFFTQSLEELAETSEKYLDFIGFDAENVPSHMYYFIEVNFHRFVPLTPETSGLALAQVGHYAVMDQIHQYTFAEVSSNMIAEIGYTEVLTMMSTIASAPAMIFETYKSYEAAKKAGEKMTKSLAQTLFEAVFKAIVVAPISEMIEEIVIDNIVEGIVETLVRELGGSESLGFWLSTLATSAKEKLSIDSMCDASMNKKQQKIAKLNEDVAKLTIEADTTNNLDVDNKQEIMDDINAELQQKKAEIATLERKIEVRNNLKMASSVIIAASSLFFGGVSLAGISNLISTSYEVCIKESLEQKIYTGVKQAAQKHQTSKELASNAIDLLDGKNIDTDLNTLATTAKTLLKASDAKSGIDSNVDKKVEPIPQSQDTKAGQKLEESTSKLDKIKAKFKERFNLWAEHVLGLSGLSYKESHQILDEETSKIKELENGKDLKDVYGQDEDGNLIKSDLMKRYEHMHNGKKAVGIFGLTRGYEKFALQKRQELRSFATVAYANSEADFIKVFIENAQQNHKKLGVAKCIGRSMLGKIAPGAKVAYIEKAFGEVYEKGNTIIFYNENGVKVMHGVVEVLKNENGEITGYKTKGYNNEKVDSGMVRSDQIIGQVVGFSEQGISGLIEMAKKGRVPYIQALGMTQEVNLIRNFVNQLSEIITNVYGHNDIHRELMLSLTTITSGDSLEIMFDIMNKIQYFNPLTAGIVGNPNDFRNIKKNLLRECNNFISENILSGYSIGLFEKIFSYLYRDLYNPHLPLNKHNPFSLSNEQEFDILREVFICVHKYYENSKLYEHLERKGILNDKDNSEKGVIIGHLIQKIFSNDIDINYKFSTYRELLNKVVEETFTYGGEKLENTDILYRAECKNHLKNDLDANIYVPNEIYLNFGENKFTPNKRKGYGIVHIFVAHLEDFTRLHPNLNTPEKIADFISNIIGTQEGVVMEEVYDGIMLGYAFRFEGEDRIRYLQLMIDDGTNPDWPKGRLHTAYPVDTFYIDDVKRMDTYEAYLEYFNANGNLIGECAIPDWK